MAQDSAGQKGVDWQSILLEALVPSSVLNRSTIIPAPEKAAARLADPLGLAAPPSRHS